MIVLPQLKAIFKETSVLQTELDAIGRGIARIPSGCSILTVTHGDRSTGMLVSWVQQAAFVPPSISVCVKDGRPPNQLIDAAGRFVLNVIGQDPAPLFKHFAKGFSLEEDAFDGLESDSSPFGPTLRSAVAHLGCAVTDKVTVGDHILYVATVEAADTAADVKPFVHLRRNGLSY